MASSYGSAVMTAEQTTNPETELDTFMHARIDEIKARFAPEAMITVLIRHGENGDSRDVLYGDDEGAALVIGCAYTLKRAPSR